MLFAVRAKRILSFTTCTFVEIGYLFEGIGFVTFLARGHFEELCHDLFQYVLDPIEKSLRDSKIHKAKINEVVLVGGPAHIPRIVRVASAFFSGKGLIYAIDPDEAVACGAAIHAAILSGDTLRIFRTYSCSKLLLPPSVSGPLVVS